MAQHIQIGLRKECINGYPSQRSDKHNNNNIIHSVKIMVKQSCLQLSSLMLTVVIHIQSGLILHTWIFGGGIDEEVSNPSTLESFHPSNMLNTTTLCPLHQLFPSCKVEKFFNLTVWFHSNLSRKALMHTSKNPVSLEPTTSRERKKPRTVSVLDAGRH